MRTTSNQTEVLPPGIVQVYEGSSATLNWNFSLSEGLGLGFSIKFNAITIVSIGKDGSPASSITAEFQERFSVSATPQSASDCQSLPSLLLMISLMENLAVS